MGSWREIIGSAAEVAHSEMTETPNLRRDRQRAHSGLDCLITSRLIMGGSNNLLPHPTTIREQGTMRYGGQRPYL